MAVDFYDVKTRAKVSIDEKNISKTTFETANGQTRYGIRGKTSDGRTLTKFVSKGDWDNFDVPFEKTPPKAKAADGDKKATKSSTKSKSKKK